MENENQNKDFETTSTTPDTVRNVSTNHLEQVQSEQAPIASDPAAHETPMEEGAFAHVLSEVEEQLDEEKENAISFEAFAHFSKSELLEKLKGLAQTDDVIASWQEIRALRKVYNDMLKEEEEKAYQDYITDGGLKEEFNFIRDESHPIFMGLFSSFDQARQELKKKKDAELAQNVQVKRKIIEHLKELAESATKGSLSIKAIFDQLHEQQELWRNTGMAPAGENKVLADAYRFACDKVYEYIKIDKELRELNYKKNLEVKKELCEKAEKLILEPSLRTALDGIKQLQDEWKEAGLVSKEMNEVIWERFKKAGDQIFARLKEYLQNQNEHQEKNKNGKLALIQELEQAVEKLPESSSAWQKATEHLEGILTQWKQLGFASKKDNEELWNRFKELRNRFFKAKEHHFESLRKVHQENYRIKNDLCMKAEEVKESTEWKKTTDLIISLQKQWKETGPVNHRQSDKIWQRFRSACDHYFERKKANFADQDAMQAENLQAKLDLIAQIEAYQPSEDHQINFEKLKSFQNEWLDIGHIPIKQKDQVNNAYRKAIDKHFDAMRVGNFERNKQNFQNKINLMTSRPDAKNKVNEELYQLQEKIRKKEHEAALLNNNLGFFVNSKGAESILKDTKKKLESLGAEVKLMKEQLKILRNVSQSEAQKK